MTEEHEQLQDESHWEDIKSNKVSRQESPPVESKLRVPFKNPRTNRTSTVKIIALIGDNLNEEEHRQRLNEQMCINPDRSVSCKVCGKNIVSTNIGNAKQKMRGHIETHMEGLSYPCQHCEKIFRSKNAYVCHKRRSHRF